MGLGDFYEKIISLNLSKKDGQWVVDELAEDDDFYNAITGGMIATAKKSKNMFDTDTNN